MYNFINSWNFIGILFMGWSHLQRVFPLVMILLYWTGIRVYKLEGNILAKFSKDIKWASMYDQSEGSDEPLNWISGLWFLGYIELNYSRDDPVKRAYVLCHKSLLRKYTNSFPEEKIKEDPEKKPITVFEREGGFWRIKYQKINLQFRKMIPRHCQQQAIDKILKNYNEKKYSTVLLYGSPGCGKSMLGILLAKQILKAPNTKVNFVDSFCPSDPGEEFISLYTKVSPTEKSPLIVVLEEVDILVDKMHKNEIKSHDSLPVLIKNKTDWNIFFDKFDRERFPYVIFIMTSNQHLSWFNKLDPAYFRDGRVNLKIEMKK